MPRRRLALIGWGRVGKACAAALHGHPDLELAGVVRRPESVALPAAGLPHGAPAVGHVRELGGLHAALLCVPGSIAAGVAGELLQAGIAAIDCASLDETALRRHEATLAHAAQRHRTAVVLGAGWDPGLLDRWRRGFERLVPSGQTRLTRRVAAGLHHTAAVEAVPGVQGALSSEVHEAGGRHRYLYIRGARGADTETIRRRVLADPLFADVPTEVLFVEDLSALGRPCEGVLLERLGEERGGPHASLMLEARADPVVFTGRLMVDAARLLPAHARGAWSYTPDGLLPWSEG